MKQITLDTETIPDAAACAAAGIDPAAGFPPWCLHEILCVSILEVTSRGHGELDFAIDTYSRAELSEEAILREVERRVEDANEVLTFNGRGFDVPVLLARAATTQTAVSRILELGNRANVGRHADLLERVSSFRGAPKVTLAQLCAAFQIPVKLEAAGGDVAELAAAGELARISSYCETDVVATWLADRMWQSASRQGYGEEGWTRLAAWIGGEQPRLAHLLPYSIVPRMWGGACLTPEHLREPLVF